MTTNQSDRANGAAEERYRHLFEHMPICIFVADLTVTPPVILDANRRAQLVYGYTDAEFTGMPAAYLIPAEARAAVLTIVQRVQQGQTVTAETTNQVGIARAFPCASSPRPIRLTPAI